MIAHYRGRVSGPLLDRFDLQVEMPPLPVKELRGKNRGEPSATVAARILQARQIQRHRLCGAGICTNAMMTSAFLGDHSGLDEAGARLLTQALQRLGLSARAHDGVLRVARTIADLEGVPKIRASHVAEAIQYRCLDRTVLGSRATE